MPIMPHPIFVTNPSLTCSLFSPICFLFLDLRFPFIHLIASDREELLHTSHNI